MSTPKELASATTAGGVTPPTEERLGPSLTDRYRLDNLLGAGGMGAVWRATDQALKRSVAIKLVSVNEATARARFSREARLASSLDHPGIVRVYDVGEAGAVCFLVMELLSGETLASRHGRERLTLTEALRVVTDVAETMAFAHGRGLVHRDLKPENLFLHADATSTRTVVIDFGLSFAMEGDPDVGRVTRGDLIAGTPAYMSPEQARGQDLGPPSDVYSLGCIFFELLGGHPPFEGPPQILLSQHAFAAPPRLRDVWFDAPIVLDDLVDAMVAKQSDSRPDMAAVAATCRALLPNLDASDGGATLRERSAVGALPRSARAISRVTPAVDHASTDVPGGFVVVVGDVEDGIFLSLAASGLAAMRGGESEVAGCDVVLAAVPISMLPTLVACGRPVIAIHDGTIEQVLALIRIGCADAAAADASGAVLARKIQRALRWRHGVDPRRGAS